MSNSIWLYFNKQGKNIVKITQGYSLRQGSSFSIVFAFEDYSMIRNRKLKLSYKLPGSDKEMDYGEEITFGENEKIIFHKTGREITFGLIDGCQYTAKEIHFSNDITCKYGNLTLITRIEDENNPSLLKYQGNVQLYIEPTYMKGNYTPSSSNDSYTKDESDKRYLSSVKVENNSNFITLAFFKDAKVITRVDIPTIIEQLTNEEIDQIFNN